MIKPQWLPGCPEGMRPIGPRVQILEKDGQVIDLVGTDHYFSHPAGDPASRRLALASLMANGHVKACELERTLGIPHRTLMNWGAQCRQKGPSSCFRVATRGQPRIMTVAKMAECAR